MKEGFEFLAPNKAKNHYDSYNQGDYGLVKKIRPKREGIIDFKDLINPSNEGCLVFVKDTKIYSGKFKTNPINYLFPFFPNYIDYMLQIAPYFFIHEEYLEKLEKYQPIYDFTSAAVFLEENDMVVIDRIKKTITFRPLGKFEDNGMLILPTDKVKIEKTNYTFSKEAKNCNQRQYDMADNDWNTKYGRDKLANTLGYCTNEKRGYVRPPKPIIYNGEEYDFRAEKK